MDARGSGDPTGGRGAVNLFLECSEEEEEEISMEALLSPRVTLHAGTHPSTLTEWHTEALQAVASKLGTRGNSGAPRWWHEEKGSDVGRSGLGLMSLGGVWASLESLRDSRSVCQESL